MKVDPDPFLQASERAGECIVSAELIRNRIRNKVSNLVCKVCASRSPQKAFSTTILDLDPHPAQKPHSKSSMGPRKSSTNRPFSPLKQQVRSDRQEQPNNKRKRPSSREHSGSSSTLCALACADATHTMPRQATLYMGSWAWPNTQRKFPRRGHSHSQHSPALSLY